MKGYPSLVKGTVLKTVRSFATRGFEPHTFLIIKLKELICQTSIKNGPRNNVTKRNDSQQLQTKLSSENGPKNNVTKLKNF